MSTRSFTRHLADEGTTFGEILERLRLHLATGYLADNRMSSQQIACRSAIRILRRSPTPTNGGPEQRRGEREGPLRRRDKRPLVDERSSPCSFRLRHHPRFRFY